MSWREDFGADIDNNHHPGIDTLHLPEDVASTWKQRLRTVKGKDGGIRPRKELICRSSSGSALSTSTCRNGLWRTPPGPQLGSVPSPVRKGETAGQMKLKKKTTAEMHQRTRDRLPRLPALVDTAEQRKTEQATLLAAASAAVAGQTFRHDGHDYQRIMPGATPILISARHTPCPCPEHRRWPGNQPH